MELNAVEKIKILLLKTSLSRMENSNQKRKKRNANY
jgi:hypothetical protein